MTRKRSITPYTFLLPALVLLGIFVVYPIIAVVYYSFTDYDIATPPVWVGLDNFAKLLDDETFRLAVVHSFVYLLVTPILIFLSIVLAIIVNRRHARHPHLPGAVLRARGQRQHRHRAGLALAVRPERASSTAILQSWGVIDQPDPVARRRRRSSCRSRCC